MNQITSRAAWAEIDLAALRHNIDLIRGQVGRGRKLIAVVKANAYGHGAVRISREALAAGCDLLAVATLDELAQLRAGNITAPTLVLGYLPPSAYSAVISLGGQITVTEADQLPLIDQAAATLGRRALVQIKLDTGMHRLGWPPDLATVEALAAASALPNLQLAGIYSHLATADSSQQEASRAQLARFQHFLDLCRERQLRFPLIHLANSAAIAALPEAWFNAVRPGLILYGCQPSAEVGLAGLRPLMSVQARVAQLRTLGRGEAVSYGGTWRAPGDSRIATIPLGYADGIPRLLSNSGCALVNGQRAPIVGRVCMDQLMLDVSKIPNLQVGDQVTLLGPGLTAEEVAQTAQTINYELLCRLGARLERRYLNSEVRG